MAISTTIEIDDKQVEFKASAALPRFYFYKFGRDIFDDIGRIGEALSKADGESGEEKTSLDLSVLSLFEDIAWSMAKKADPSIPDTSDEWLNNFSMFSIYQIAPQIFALWNQNATITAESKKNSTN